MDNNNLCYLVDAKRPNGRHAFSIDASTGCWIWLGPMSPSGYGKVERGKRCFRAHRYVYEFFRGPIPSVLLCDHVCRNRACVNPDHIDLVTQKENVHRGLRLKLTDEQARAVRVDPRSAKVVAVEYGISQSHVYNIRNGYERTLA